MPRKIKLVSVSDEAATYDDVVDHVLEPQEPEPEQEQEPVQDTPPEPAAKAKAKAVKRKSVKIIEEAPEVHEIPAPESSTTASTASTAESSPVEETTLKALLSQTPFDETPKPKPKRKPKVVQPPEPPQPTPPPPPVVQEVVKKQRVKREVKPKVVKESKPAEAPAVRKSRLAQRAELYEKLAMFALPS